MVTRVGRKAADRPTPICFWFAHTADDILADSAAHDGVSAITAEIEQAVANGHCACEHLNPSTKCCLGDIYRTLKAARAGTGRVSHRTRHQPAPDLPI